MASKEGAICDSPLRPRVRKPNSEPHLTLQYPGALRNYSTRSKILEFLFID